jgi:diaminopimelate decarboxylase
MPTALAVDDTADRRTCLYRFRADLGRSRQTVAMSLFDLFPVTAAIDDGELTIGGIRGAKLADDFGTPLLVYCEATLQSQAAAYRNAAPDALIVYGTKAFPNVAIMRLFADLGFGADVSSLGELEFARRAGIPGERVVFHGNNKSDDELAAAAKAQSLVVLDATDEIPRAKLAGVRRALLRLTPGVEAETHESIRTAHAESKFGFDDEQAFAAMPQARAALDLVGVHLHIGSQLARLDESVESVRRLVDFCRRCRNEHGWTPEIVDLGGGLGVRHSRDEQVPTPKDFVDAVVSTFRTGWEEPVKIVLEPGRSLIGRAGVSLYTIGARKRSGGVDYAAIDGGMSDNPRPQLYGARYEALLANRAAQQIDGTFRIAGKHCESGDVLIDAVSLPAPKRGDILAVPATGAYTLAMASNYNGIARPAAVLVADGKARLIRRRETIADVLAYEAGA